jgi:hypothetical protein
VSRDELLDWLALGAILCCLGVALGFMVATLVGGLG